MVEFDGAVRGVSQLVALPPLPIATLNSAVNISGARGGDICYTHCTVSPGPQAAARACLDACALFDLVAVTDQKTKTARPRKSFFSTGNHPFHTCEREKPKRWINTSALGTNETLRSMVSTICSSLQLFLLKYSHLLSGPSVCFCCAA